MEFVNLGSGGPSVSRIGFGCAAIGGYDYGRVDDAESIAAIRRALEVGINLFDTAAVYGFGHAEEVLGRALGRDRGGAVVATKCGVDWDDAGRVRRDGSPQAIERGVDSSLRRLKVERIDLCQLHWLDGRTPVVESVAALERLQQAGKVAFIGVCNVDDGEVAQAQYVTRVDTVQLPFSILDRKQQVVLNRCRDLHSMGLLGYSTLAHGYLTAASHATRAFDKSDLRLRHSFVAQTARRAAGVADRIGEVAARQGKTRAQVVIRWACQQVDGLVALVGAKRPAQVDDNVGAVGWWLSAADLAMLDFEEGSI